MTLRSRSWASSSALIEAPFFFGLVQFYGNRQAHPPLWGILDKFEHYRDNENNIDSFEHVAFAEL